MSFQRAPLSRIHRMPSRTFLGSFQTPPLPSDRRGSGGRSGSMSCQSSFFSCMDGIVPVTTASCSHGKPAQALVLGAIHETTSRRVAPRRSRRMLCKGACRRAAAGVMLMFAPFGEQRSPVSSGWRQRRPEPEVTPAGQAARSSRKLGLREWRDPKANGNWSRWLTPAKGYGKLTGR